MPLMEKLYELQNKKLIELSPFFYSSQFVGTIVGGATGISQNVSIQADSHFVIRYISVMTYVSAAGIPILPNTGLAALTLSLFDTGSGRLINDNPQAIQNVCGGVAAGGGQGSLPFILPEPWLVRASGVIQLTVSNLSPITFPRVDFSFAGLKVFSFGGGSAPNV